MVNADYDDTDFEPALGYSNNCIRTRLNKNSGAGVNAGSVVDMTFAASDSLSELVWSPHNGLRLKSAECSLADKKPLLLWNVGPSNMVPLLSQSNRSNGIDDEKKGEGNLIITQAEFHLNSEVSERASLTRSPRKSAWPIVESSHGHNIESGDEKEGEKIDGGILAEHSSQNREHLGEEGKEPCDPHSEQVAAMAQRSQRNPGPLIQKQLLQGHSPLNFDMAIDAASSGNLNKESSSDFNPIIRSAVIGSQIAEEVATAAEIDKEIPSEAHVSSMENSPCLDGPTKEAKETIEEDRKNNTKIHGSMVLLAEKLEYTAENDLRHRIAKDSYQQSEERLVRACSLPLETSPENCSSHFYLLKGKDKALSDGNSSRRFSLDKDDSQESVESCNSAWLLGKRQWNFDQQLIGESKRMKQIDGSPASASIIRHDNSFMNWISNMVKGFSKSNQEEGPSLDLTLAHSSHRHTNILQETITCSKQQDSGSRKMGFQTVFQSLYCPNTKLLEARVSRDDSSVEGLQDTVQADKIFVQSSPISSSGLNGASCDHIFMTNKKMPPSRTEDVVVQSCQPWNLPAITPSQNDIGANCAENKAPPNNQDSGKSANGRSSSDSLGIHKITVAENDKPHLASNARATYDLSNKSNLFGSLWITRFSRKTSSSSMNVDHSKKDDCQASDGRRPNPQTSPDYPLEEKYTDSKINSIGNSGELGKEFQTYAANTNSSLGFKEVSEHNCQNSLLKLNAVLPSPRFKSSEAMASVFAKRLDALKHIIASEATSNATCAAPTCFFCGRSGHNLRDCSEISETEVEDLLRNMSSYDWAEDSPCLCIRCFQLDHWAIMCPLFSSTGQQHLENKMFSVNCWNPGNQICSGNERKSVSFDKEDHLKISGCSREIPFTNTGLKNPMSDANEFSGKRSLSSNETQNQITSNSGENKSKKHQNVPMCNLVSMQIAEVPKGVFDAVRQLQVSRSDIVKWINSNFLLPHLEGLFLRLRLGNWEAGLGGTGYYVACITGVCKYIRKSVEQAGEPPKDSKNSISVNVGGIKCLVGSQYVSNQDFLEDELMVWWCKTVKSGGKVPSREDLESKFKQRIKLGF